MQLHKQFASTAVQHKLHIVCRACIKNLWNKSSGKKFLNTTFYSDQKGINKFIKGKSGLKGNKQAKTIIF